MKKENRILVISGFVSYGDILYSTPILRFIKRRLKATEMHVWSCNPEPLRDNPDIDELWHLTGHSLPPIPQHYFDKVYQLKNDGPLVHGMSRFHTIDFFSLNLFGTVLRQKNKNLILRWSDDDYAFALKLLKENKIGINDFVVISPTINWPSRTLPLEYYKEIISRIQQTGMKVVLVGKDVNPTKEWDSPHLTESGLKKLYDSAHFPGATDFTNQFMFKQLAALYSLARIAINTENGNMVISCTNDNCWNLYIPSCTAPEFRLPWRKGSQHYKTVVIGNADDWYPQDTTEKRGDLINAKVKLPTVNEIIEGYLLANWGWTNGYTTIPESRN